MNRVIRLGCLLFALCLAPAVAFAQASISGVVRDTSGAVLPGVTVEASSPALIEKVRSVVTDGSGQFRIVDLRPGTYAISFALQGFATVRREGIELTGTFNATVNGELRVGTVTETVTVTGESPIVDIQSATKQQVLQKEVIDAIPVGRSHQSLAILIPASPPAPASTRRRRTWAAPTTSASPTPSPSTAAAPATPTSSRTASRCATSARSPT
jgi:hypothetical protein